MSMPLKSRISNYISLMWISTEKIVANLFQVQTSRNNLERTNSIRTIKNAIRYTQILMVYNLKFSIIVTDNKNSLDRLIAISQRELNNNIFKSRFISLFFCFFRI